MPESIGSTSALSSRNRTNFYVKNSNLKPHPTMKTATVEPSETLAAPRDDATELAPPIIHLKNILVPLDLSEMSLKSLHYAVPFAEQFGAKLTLLHVVHPPAYNPELPYPVELGVDYSAVIEKQLDEDPSPARCRYGRAV